MAQKLSRAIALLWLTFTTQAFGWSWIEQIYNYSNYPVTIRNQGDHGRNYVKVTLNGKIVTEGNMGQKEFTIPAGGAALDMDGFALAVTGNMYSFNTPTDHYTRVKIDGRSEHRFREYSNVSRIAWDDKPQYFTDGIFTLIIKKKSDLSPKEAHDTSAYVQDGDLVLYLKRIIR